MGTFDNLVVSTDLADVLPVPEPATISMAASAAIFGWVFAAIRRRKAAW